MTNMNILEAWILLFGTSQIILNSNLYSVMCLNALQYKPL